MKVNGSISKKKWDVSSEGQGWHQDLSDGGGALDGGRDSSTGGFSNPKPDRGDLQIGCQKGAELQYYGVSVEENLKNLGFNMKLDNFRSTSRKLRKIWILIFLKNLPSLKA